MNAHQRGEFLRKFIDSVRTQDYPYDKRAPKRVNWRAYDVAQAHEIADMIEIIRVSVDVAARRLETRRRRKRGRGQPPIPPSDVVKALLMQSYMGVPNRVAEGFLLLFGSALGLSESFSYKTIERGYSRREVDELLDEVLALTNLPVKDLEKVFSVDGSGTPTRKRQNYADTRAAQRKGSKAECPEGDAFPSGRHDFVYSVFMVGATYKLISSWRNTCRHDIGETFFFDELMHDTKALHPGMEMVVGDGLYAGRPQCDAVQGLGAIPRFLPRRNATLKRRGSVGWIPMLMAMTRDPDGWMKDYYQREASENANSVLKNDNPQPLRKRLPLRRCTEDKLRGLCYNLKRLCYLHHLAGLSVHPVLLANAS